MQKVVTSNDAVKMAVGHRTALITAWWTGSTCILPRRTLTTSVPTPSCVTTSCLGRACDTPCCLDSNRTLSTVSACRASARRPASSANSATQLSNAPSVCQPSIASSSSLSLSWRGLKNKNYFRTTSVKCQKSRCERERQNREVR